MNKVVVYADRVEVYLNVLPALMSEDYGLDIDNRIFEKSEEDGENSSSSLILVENMQNTPYYEFTGLPPLQFFHQMVLDASRWTIFNLTKNIIAIGSIEVKGLKIPSFQSDAG